MSENSRSSNIEVYPCNICDRVTNSAEALRRHFYGAHPSPGEEQERRVRSFLIRAHEASLEALGNKNSPTHSKPERKDDAQAPVVVEVLDKDARRHVIIATNEAVSRTLQSPTQRNYSCILAHQEASLNTPVVAPDGVNVEGGENEVEVASRSIE
ncbi:hypothetical protein ACFE04_004948 [Oxalis oulophora]